MGARLTKLSSTINAALLSVLDSSPAYRNKLLSMLQQYSSDPSVSDAQGLQWSAERLVSDATNQSHEIGSRFLPLLAQIDLNNFDATTVTQCIAQGAMQYLEGQVDKLSSLSKFVDINYQNESGSTALMIAAHHNHPSLVSHLLSVHAKVNLQDSLGWSALMFACREGHMRIVEILMEEDVGAEMDLATKTGITALMCAADAGHVQIVKLLLEKGSNVNACTNAGDTALLQACHGGHTQVVKLLLHASADVNVTGKHLCSPSLLASRFGSYEILELLIQFGADLSAQDDEGRTICDFEYQGQIAAAIQRGVVGRFNKMISKPAGVVPFGSTWGRKPFGSGSVFAHQEASAAAPVEGAAAASSSSAASLNGYMHQTLMETSESPVTKLPLHSTPHPSKLAHPHAFHMEDEPDVNENSPSMSPLAATSATATVNRSNRGPTSQSRSPSPSMHDFPNVRVRQSRMFSSAAETPSRSRAFYHNQTIGDDGLTDEQLAAMEADVEQILHRREQQRTGKGSNSVNERPVLTLDSNEAVQSIVKAARIDSPRAGRKGERQDDTRGSRVEPGVLFVPSYRSTSDNVHQYEDESYTDLHQQQSQHHMQPDHEPRFHNHHTQSADEGVLVVKRSDASSNFRADVPPLLCTVDEEECDNYPKRHVARVHADPTDSNSYESVIHMPLHGQSNRVMPGHSASAPPPVSLPASYSSSSSSLIPPTTSPYMRVLDEHLAMRQSPFTPDSLSTIGTGDMLPSPVEETDEKEQELHSQSAAALPTSSPSDESVSELRILPRLHDADAAPSPLSTLTPGSLLVDSAPADDETLLARELARLNAGLPVDAEHEAQVAAHLAAHAQPLAAHTAHTAIATEASQLLADPNAIPIRNTRKSEQSAKKEPDAADDNSTLSMSNKKGSPTKSIPPQHVIALRNAIAEASERSVVPADVAEKDRTLNDNDSQVSSDGEEHGPLLEESNSVSHSPASASHGSAESSIRSTSSSASNSSIQKRKARKAKRVLAEINDAPTAPRVLTTSLSPSFSPAVAAPVLNPIHLNRLQAPNTDIASDSNLSLTSAARNLAHTRLSSASPGSASASPFNSAHSSPVYSNTTSPVVSRRGSASLAGTITPVSQGAATPPSASSSVRFDQERLVDNWLLEHGFDSVSRSSLAGFTFADMYNLDLNDCTELLGEQAGATLFAKLKRKWKEAGVSAKSHHAIQAERDRDREKERIREREKMLRQEKDQQPDETTVSAVNGILAAAAAAEFDSDDDEEIEFDEKEEMQRFNRNGSRGTPSGAMSSSHQHAAAAAPLLLSPSPTLSASSSPPASAPLAVAQPVAAAVPRPASTSASSSVKSFSFKDSIKSSFLSKSTITAPVQATASVPPPIVAAKYAPLQAALPSSSASIRVTSSSVSLVNNAIQKDNRSNTHLQSIDDGILRNSADDMSPSVSSESASSTASSTSSSSILPIPIPIPIPSLPSSEKIASVLAANAVAPALTGYYTQDLLNSQKAWLASSLESLHFRLQGTSKREEMRKNQPHRLRRAQAQAQQSVTDESGDDEKHAETRAGILTGLNPTLGQSVGSISSSSSNRTSVSAWDQLGEKLGESPESTPTQSPLINAAMKRSSHQMQPHTRAVGGAHALSNSNGSFSVSRGIHNTAGVSVMQPPPPPPPLKPKAPSKTSFSSDYLTSF